jgi:Ca-activated chloride channel family protein
MKIIDFKSYLDNPLYLKNSEKKELYIYVDLKAAFVEKDADRVPLNIALVVDRSGSMSGEKLEYVKKATDFVIDNLNSNDHLSIVQYDDKVDVVSPTQPVTNKKQLHQKVASIRAGGMTNLSGGMLEGYSQVEASKSDKYVNRVLLLSDGLANEGITDPEKLRSIAQKRFRERGIGLSTFGVGADFNELLMTNLAEYGGANYYFIDMPDRIPEIFAKELEGLLSVVAQNAKLKIQIPDQYLKCTKVYGYPATITHKGVSVNFNDIFSEEQKAVLLKFEVLRTINEPLKFQLDFSYDDAVEVLEKVNVSHTLTLQPTTDKKAYEQSVHPLTAQNVALFEANALYDEAMLLADKGQFEPAKKLVAKAITMVEAILRLKNYSRGEMLMAQKSSRMANYMLRKKK